MKRMLFLRVGWMRSYQGPSADDRITSGAAFVKEHNYGHEVYNFKRYNGYMYGYAKVYGAININRLGAFPKDQFIDDVLVVWVSKSPSDGVVIVGWYDNATVYRDLRPFPARFGRTYEGEGLEGLTYRVRAKAENCTLLPMDERTFSVPQNESGKMGRASIWYASGEENIPFRQDVLTFLRSRKVPP